MEPEPVITLVGTRCQPEMEERFNAWYNDLHLPTLFTDRGLKKITRYKLLPDAPAVLPSGPAPWLTGGPAAYPSYLAVSEFRSREARDAYERSDLLAEERRAMRALWEHGGWTLEWKVSYEPLKTWKR